MKKSHDLSVYLCFLLRHHPETIGLHMDCHGWVSVEELIEKVNAESQYALTREILQGIADADDKGRYRIDRANDRIKCCQGHSIPWVQPELTYAEPPEILYHGTTTKAYEKIKECGAIKKMNRHAVHLTAKLDMAWRSAKRWHIEPAVLRIVTAPMVKAGIAFGVTENDVWCVEEIPVEYIDSVLKD